MKTAVRSLITYLEAREVDLGVRRRARHVDAQRSYRCAAEAVACNLAWSATDPLGRPLAVPRDHSVLWGGGRYAHECYGQGFLDVLSLMARPEVGLIEDLGRGHKCDRGSSSLSTVKATSSFLARHSPEDVTWRDFRLEPPPEVLVLKAPKAAGAESSERMDYKDTAHTRKLRREVERLNRTLAAAPFWFVVDEGPLGLDGLGNPIDPLRRSVRRVFNNGHFKDGGRLFDGVWETMRRPDRFRLLRIGSAQHPEGEKVANVDFRSLNPVLCYLLSGLPVPAGELYDAFGDGSCRAGFKVLTSAMLFASRRFRHLPREARAAFPAGMETNEAIAAVERFHAPIAHLFWTGYGHRLAHVESTILLTALEDLRHQGVTALPLHDSVLVARSEAEQARTALEAAFAPFGNGHRAAISIDFGETYQ